MAVEMARETAMQIVASMPSTHVIVWCAVWIHDGTSRVGIRFTLTLDDARTPRGGFIYRLEPHQIREIRQVPAADSIDPRCRCGS